MGELVEPQEQFEKNILPMVDEFATNIFSKRFPGDLEMIEELSQEARGLAWKSFLSIIKKGKQADDFAAAIAYRACQGVLKGRRTAAQEKPASISNPQTRAEMKIKRKRLGKQAERVLQRKAPPLTPDQVGFEIDYAEWLLTQGAKGPIIADMAGGEHTKTLAERFAKSPGRISQIRREAAEDWMHRFPQDEPPGKER
jgi:hypothetical protein